MNQKFTLVKGLFFAAIIGFLFTSSSGGLNSQRAGAPGGEGTCIGCHNAGPTNLTDGFAILSGAPTSITPNTTYNMTLEVSDADAVNAGFQIVASDGTNGNMVGTFTATTGTRVVGSGGGIGRLTHSSPQNFNSGSADWAVTWTSPASPPANVTFYFAVNAANGNGGNGNDDAIYVSQSAAIALPVELSSFEVAAEDQTVHLTWTTETERNNAFFAIERSGDGYRFEEIGRVQGQGTSSIATDYQYEDLFPMGGNNYYRLRQVDEDGTEEYSKIEVVTFEAKDAIQWAIYPNPASDQIAFRQIGTYQENIVVEIFDAQGRQVERIQTSELETTVSINDYPAGLYFMKWQANGASGSERFVKR